MSSHTKLLNLLGYKSRMSFSVPKLGKPFPFILSSSWARCFMWQNKPALSFLVFMSKLHFIFQSQNENTIENVFEERQKYQCLKYLIKTLSAFFSALPTASHFHLSNARVAEHGLWQEFLAGMGLWPLGYGARKLRNQILITGMERNS